MVRLPCVKERSETSKSVDPSCVCPNSDSICARHAFTTSYASTGGGVGGALEATSAIIERTRWASEFGVVI
jgi:hypothetical protein